MSTKPIGNNVILYRDESADKELYGSTFLSLPESTKGRNQCSIITDVGPEVRDLFPGDRVVTKRITKDTDGVVALDANRFLVPRKMILMRMRFGQTDGHWWRSYEPFGRNVLVRRLNREFKTKTGIIVPDMAMEQTPFSVVVEVGSGVTDLRRGDRVMVEWSTAIVEVGLSASSDEYYLIVPLEGIRFAFDHDIEDIDAENRQESIYEDKRKKKYVATRRRVGMV